MTVSLANLHVLEMAVRDSSGSRVAKQRWDAAKAEAGVVRSVPVPEGRGTVITATDAMRTLTRLHDGDREHARAVLDGLLADPPERAVWSGPRTRLQPWTPVPDGSLAAADALEGSGTALEGAMKRGRGGVMVALGFGVAVSAAYGVSRLLGSTHDTAGPTARPRRERQATKPRPTRAPASSSPATDHSPPPTTPLQPLQPVTTPESPPAHAKGAAAFRIASFNTLGASHTAGGEQHADWPSGPSRTPGMLGYLALWNVDVAGLQEFEPSQRAKFRAQHSEYHLSTRGANSITWDSRDFALVKERSVRIPYFNGHVIDMPVVQLEHRASGKRAWFVDIHNPADTSRFHHQAGHRRDALKREQDLLAELRATGLPVYLVGDFNDREIARDAITADGRTTTAAPASGHEEIDWIFGTGPMRFTGYHADHRPQRSRTADHPIVVADTELT
jgi:hypothetical protein